MVKLGACRWPSIRQSTYKPWIPAATNLTVGRCIIEPSVRSTKIKSSCPVPESVTRSALHELQEHVIDILPSSTSLPLPLAR